VNNSVDNRQSNATASISVPQDHPALAGHFPGNPVVPGVVILELVRQYIEAEYAQAMLRQITHAKFSSPLRPGQTMQIEITRVSDMIRFSCRHGSDTIASGAMLFAVGE